MNKTVLMIVVVLCSLVAIGDACPSCDTYPCLGVPLCRRSASSRSKDGVFISIKKDKSKIEIEREKTERQRDRETERQKDRKAERQKDRETEKQRDA